MEKINCPICGQDNAEIIFKKGNLDKDLINVICKNCSIIYIDSRPAKEEYDKFHEAEFLSEKSVTNIGEVKLKLKESDLAIKKSTISFLEEYLKKESNVLDIGCGFGTFLDIIKKKTGANVFGIELGNLDVAAAKEFYGLGVFHGSLEEFAKNSENWNKFDVIVMHHVLEHLPEPANSLEQIKKLLRPDGILYIGVPNVMNIKKRPEIFFQRAHPFSYSPYSLKLILEKVGFGTVKFNRNAGYPGGMEVVARPSAQSIVDVALEEGLFYENVIDCIVNKERTFNKLRRFRDALLFFIPKDWRIRIGRIFYKILKNI